MTTIRSLSLTLVLVSMALAANAQSEQTPAASTPSVDTAMPQDCARPMAKHDHGAEKGTPRSLSGPCARPATAPAAAASASKVKLRHDHGKVHKNQ